MINDHDIYLLREGTHARLSDRLGCHLRPGGGADFAVWAPNAQSVSVIGDWNFWSGDADRLQPRHDGSGIWQGFATQAQRGQGYKYRIHSRHNGYVVDKADPFAIYAEAPPATASRIWSLEYEWADPQWMAARGPKNALDAPMAVYEVHLGSWRRQDGHFYG